MASLIIKQVILRRNSFEKGYGHGTPMEQKKQVNLPNYWFVHIPASNYTNVCC